MKIAWRTVIVLLFALVWMAGCGTATPEPTSEPPRPSPTTVEETEESTEAPTEEEPTATMTEAPDDEPVEPTEEAEATEEENTSTGQIDGTIAPDEYTDTATFGQMQLAWRHDGEYLYLAMEGPTEGWISIGIEPTRAMKDADYLFGYVEDGEPKFWDAYGTGLVGATHPPDDELGGSNDIVDFAGVEEDGVTRFEIQIPLASGDEYDKTLTPGETYAIIVAMGPTDEYNSKHFFVGSGELTLRE